MLGGNAEFMAKAQMRREHFCENLLDPVKNRRMPTRMRWSSC